MIKQNTWFTFGKIATKAMLYNDTYFKSAFISVDDRNVLFAIKFYPLKVKNFQNYATIFLFHFFKYKLLLLNRVIMDPEKFKQSIR